MSDTTINGPEFDAGLAVTPRRKTRDRYALLMGITSIWLLIWFVLPIVLMALRFVGDADFWSADPVASLLSPLYLRVFINTLEVAFFVTVGCLLLGYPVAYYLTTVTPRIFNFLILLVLFPMWVNIVVRTYALLVVLGRNGILNDALIGIGIIDDPLRMMYTRGAVYLGMIQVLLPYMILTIFSAIKGIDRSLLVAARSLGAPQHQVFLRVLLPLSMPGVWGGALLVFVIALGFYVTPAILGGPTDVMIAQLIDEQANGFGNFAEATMLGLLLLLLTVVILTVYDRLFGLDRLWGRL